MQFKEKFLFAALAVILALTPFVLHINSLNKTIDTLESDIGAKTAEVKTLKNQVAEGETQYKKVAKEKEELETKFGVVVTEKDQAKKEATTQKNKVAQVTTQNKNLTDLSSSLYNASQQLLAQRVYYKLAVTSVAEAGVQIIYGNYSGATTQVNNAKWYMNKAGEYDYAINKALGL